MGKLLLTCFLTAIIWVIVYYIIKDFKSMPFIMAATGYMTASYNSKKK